MKPCDSKPSSPAPWPSWKISRPIAEGGAGREQVGDDAERGDQRRLQRDEQEQEAEREHDADHERRPRRERLLEVVVLGGGAADERARRAARAQPVDRRPTAAARRVGVGIACTSARPFPPGLGGETRRCRGRARGAAATAASRARRDDLERARRARAEGLLHLRVADAGAVVLGHDLDRGHAGLQAEHRQREQDEQERRGRP